MLIFKRLPQTSDLTEFMPIWISNANRLLKEYNMSVKKFDSYLNHEEHKVSLYQLVSIIDAAGSGRSVFVGADITTQKNIIAKEFFKQFNDNKTSIKANINITNELKKYDLYKTLKKLYVMRESLKKVGKVKSILQPYRQKVASHILRAKWTLPDYKKYIQSGVNGNIYKAYMAYLYNTFKIEATALKKEVAVAKKSKKQDELSTQYSDNVIVCYDKLKLPAPNNADAKTLIQNFAEALNPSGEGSPWSDEGPWANLPTIGKKIQEFISKIDAKSKTNN